MSLDRLAEKANSLGCFHLNGNIVSYEKKNFIKTDSQLPIDPDPRASLIAHPNLRSTVYMKTHSFSFPQDKNIQF